MARTALDLSPDEWRAYRPDARVEGQEIERRWQMAWKVARAVACITGLSSDFKVDLVAPEDCLPAWREVIQREGIEL